VQKDELNVRAARDALDAQQKRGVTPIVAWQPVFDGVAIGLTIGAACWLMVDVTRSIVGEE
jgi:hypothetical protein